MLFGRATDIRPSEIAPEGIYFSRRDIFAFAAGLALASFHSRRNERNLLCHWQGNIGLWTSRFQIVSTPT